MLPIAVPPPPVFPVQETRKAFTSFRPGPVSCDGAPVAPLATEPVMSSTGYAYAGDGAAAPYTVTFSIDIGGRPLDIAAADGAGEPSWIDTGDVLPALATWRFAAGQPHARCSVTFTVEDQPIATAPAWQVARYYALPHGNDSFPRDTFDRTVPVGSTCFDPGLPPVLLRAFPDFDAVPQRPGTRSYSLVGFDIDPRGRPRHVRVLSSDRNATLDDQAVAAVARSRFVAGAHQGCTYPYRRTPTEPLTAPPLPDIAAFRPPDAACDGQDGDWASMPPLIYPQDFQRRSIEGWAIVRYAVAPWGATGDVTVLKSEPAAAFGDLAADLVRQATRPASPRGASGCVTVVRFVMQPRHDDGFPGY